MEESETLMLDKSKTILLVVDDDVGRNRILAVLEAQGFAVLTAVDGQDAIRIV